MKVIIDTNLWVSFLIGKRVRALSRLLSNPNITICVCDELFEEFRLVTQRRKFQGIIRLEDVAAVLNLMRGCCVYAKIAGGSSSPVRDVKDLYLLSLAETVGADYIITGDKDLLALGRHHATSIISFADFMSIMGL